MFYEVSNTSFTVNIKELQNNTNEDATVNNCVRLMVMKQMMNASNPPAPIQTAYDVLYQKYVMDALEGKTK